MKSKAFAYFELMRVPNWFTAVADVLAGYLLVRGSGTWWWSLPALLLASMAIYAGGCVLNDLCDHKIDAKERPSRPIPSGRVQPSRAALLAGSLFFAGLMAAAAASLRVVGIAALLTGCVLLYDAVAKKNPWIGPFFMGACRALNLLMGMVVCVEITEAPLVYPILSLAYVFSLTVLSRYEVRGRLGAVLWVVPTLWLCVVGAVAAVTALSPFKLAGLCVLGLFVAYTGVLLGKAVFRPDARRIQAAVKGLVLGIVLLDGAYVAGTSGFLAGIMVLSCLLPSLGLARYFYVT